MILTVETLAESVWRVRRVRPFVATAHFGVEAKTQHAPAFLAGHDFGYNIHITLGRENA
jgi:hypothetical protein